MPKKTYTLAEQLAKAIRSSNWIVANEAFTKLMVEKVDAKLNEERASLLSEGSNDAVCKKCKEPFGQCNYCPKAATLHVVMDDDEMHLCKSCANDTGLIPSHPGGGIRQVHEAFIVVAPEWPSGNVDKPTHWLKTSASHSPAWVKDKKEATIFNSKADAKKAADKSMGRPSPTVVSESYITEDKVEDLLRANLPRLGMSLSLDLENTHHRMYQRIYKILGRKPSTDEMLKGINAWIVWSEGKQKRREAGSQEEVLAVLRKALKD